MVVIVVECYHCYNCMLPLLSLLSLRVIIVVTTIWAARVLIRSSSTLLASKFARFHLDRKDRLICATSCLHLIHGRSCVRVKLSSGFNEHLCFKWTSREHLENTQRTQVPRRANVILSSLWASFNRTERGGQGGINRLEFAKINQLNYCQQNKERGGQGTLIDWNLTSRLPILISSITVNRTEKGGRGA